MLTYLKFRWQRQLRRYRRSIQRWWRNSYTYLRFRVWGRWQQLAMIRRFTLVWWGIVLVCTVGLVWQTRQMLAVGAILQPQRGGTYSEGVVGRISNVNPVLPENSASADAVRLVFSGLTRFDAQGNLKPDLATSWQVSPDGRTYTFKLRKNVTWHDGMPFTAQDVAFTLAAIQNPDTRSSLATSWKGVKVEAVDDYTVVYTLPKPYSPFIQATTVGILPRHLLESVPPKMLRVADFNQKPVGTGPYKLDEIDAQVGSVTFRANKDYYGGRPLINEVVLRSYESSEQALQAYSRRQVMGVSRLRSGQVEDAKELGTIKLYEAGTPDRVGVFFRTNTGVLQDKKVRIALSYATDRSAIIKDRFEGFASAASGPLTAPRFSMIGVAQAPRYNIAAANSALDSAGWTLGADGIRQKNGQKLTIKLVTQTGTSYGDVAKQLRQQWRTVGVNLEIQEHDAMTLQQSYIRPRNYDALLYGINVGADPDVYAFWHSSQAADPGSNLSAYKSTVADQALESGRTISDMPTRSAKYRSFVQTWVNDAPAVMLYNPTYIYAVDREVRGIKIKRLVTPADRFDGIERWSVKVKVQQRH